MSEHRLTESDLWALVRRELGLRRAVRLIGWCVAWGLSGHRSLTRVAEEAGMDRSVVTATLRDLKQVLAAADQVEGIEPGRFDRLTLRQFAEHLAALGVPGAARRAESSPPSSRAV